jgi:uncharacterized membrane protein
MDALRYLPTNIVFPISSSNRALVVLLAVVFLNESLTYVQILAIALILFVIIMFYSERQNKINESRFSYAFFVAVLAMFISALALFVQKLAAISANKELFMAVSYLLCATLYPFCAVSGLGVSSSGTSISPEIFSGTSTTVSLPAPPSEGSTGIVSGTYS